MALTGRKILSEGEKCRLFPTTVGFGDFVTKFIFDYHGFTMGEEEPWLEKDIRDFVSNWSRRIAILFRSKKYQGKIKLFLEGNHPAYFDREIRFMRPRPTPTPPSPQPSGRIFNLNH